MKSDTITAVLSWQSADFWQTVAAFDTHNIDFVIESEEGWYEATLVWSPVVRLHLVPRATTRRGAIPAMMIAAPQWLCDLRETIPSHKQPRSRQ